MTDPRSLLRDFRLAQGLSCAGLGQIIGCDGSYVSHIENGRRLPGRRVANGIERLTDGQIPATAWDEIEDTDATGTEG